MNVAPNSSLSAIQFQQGGNAAPTPLLSQLALDSQVPPIIDGCGRRIDHLRISVTSVCNLRCLYCRPLARACDRTESLSDQKRLDLVRYLHENRGLHQVRLTGGEPLLHPSIVSLIAGIRSAAPGLSVAMTTNGAGLKSIAQDLLSAGLDRLNVSLDTIDPQRYRALTGGCVQDVLDGIDRAIAVGFPKPKVNTVVLKDHNDDQLIELVDWALQRGIEIRFLEAMPIGPAADFNRAHYLPASSIKSILASKYQLAPTGRLPGETAMRFVADYGAWRGTIGIIAPMSEPFCGQCRRMRLTADGKLFPCLLDSRFVDLKPCWTNEVFVPGVVDALLEQAVSGKRLAGPRQQVTSMVKLGG